MIRQPFPTHKKMIQRRKKKSQFSIERVLRELHQTNRWKAIQRIYVILHPRFLVTFPIFPVPIRFAPCPSRLEFSAGVSSQLMNVLYWNPFSMALVLRNKHLLVFCARSYYTHSHFQSRTNNLNLVNKYTQYITIKKARLSSPRPDRLY